jgi:hypothetical protein
MSADTLLSLHDRLREDRGRRELPFSQDMEEARQLMHYAYAGEDEVAEALRRWCMARQPCQFGRFAASRDQIYFCILRERDLADGDKAIAEKIAEAKRHWKQRGISDRQAPPHGCLLVFASERVTFANPDDSLRRFADHLLMLAGWAPQRRAKRGENPVFSDFLYLHNPKDGEFYGFQFNIDFFAAAGDGRWWHDHRFPGGIGFTANSTGHMLHFRDWYEKPGSDHGGWALKQAMITIAQAHAPTAAADKKGRGDQPLSPEDEGRATWLRDLDDGGKPLVERLACPIKDMPKQLRGKDWTRYVGFLHTDHAIREEFFADRDQPITRRKPYLMDFTYLFDRSQDDFVNFTGGKRFSKEEVYADIGRPETWTHRAGERRAAPDRTPEQTRQLALLLNTCLNWKPLESYIDPSLPE